MQAIPHSNLKQRKRVLPVGPFVRGLFGPYEHWIAEVYRGMFVNLDDLADAMKIWVPNAQRILEVGCGEGAMTERIVRVYPNATVTSIDVTPRVGRLFRGPDSKVSFAHETVETVAAREPASFDLVILVDVLHHVPPEIRNSVLNAVHESMTPDGRLVCKDWLITTHPIHWACDLFDRFLTGDNVAYFTKESIGTLVTGVFGPGAIHETRTVRPWKNNFTLLVQRQNYPSQDRNP